MQPVILRIPWLLLPASSRFTLTMPLEGLPGVPALPDLQALDIALNLLGQLRHTFGRIRQ